MHIVAIGNRLGGWFLFFTGGIVFFGNGVLRFGKILFCRSGRRSCLIDAQFLYLGAASSRLGRRSDFLFGRNLFFFLGFCYRRLHGNRTFGIRNFDLIGQCRVGKTYPTRFDHRLYGSIFDNGIIGYSRNSFFGFFHFRLASPCRLLGLAFRKIGIRSFCKTFLRSFRCDLTLFDGIPFFGHIYGLLVEYGINQLVFIGKTRTLQTHFTSNTLQFIKIFVFQFQNVIHKIQGYFLCSCSNTTRPFEIKGEKMLHL